MPRTISQQSLRFAIIAADVALFTIRQGCLYVRMIPVVRPPHYPDHCGLPGGLLRPEETAEEAAQRIVADKAHIAASKVHLDQFATFSRVDRDPRGRIVAVASIGVVPWMALSSREQADTPNAWWAEPRHIRRLAYDHAEMLAAARAHVTSRISTTTLIKHLMPKEFTLTELEHAYSIVLGKALDKRNFRRKMLKLGILKPLRRQLRGKKARPAELYIFTHAKIKEIPMI